MKAIAVLVVGVVGLAGCHAHQAGLPPAPGNSAALERLPQVGGLRHAWVASGVDLSTYDAVWIAPVTTRSDDLNQDEREAFRRELAMALAKQGKRIEQGGLTISPVAYWTQEKFYYEPQTGLGVDALISDGNGRQVARLRHSIPAAVPRRLTLSMLAGDIAGFVAHGGR